MEKQEKRSGQLIAQPAFRIWLCGTFRVERYVDGHYESIRTAEWGGSSYPRLLLKALLCCPGRQVRREAVMEMLWPEVDSEQAVQCLNTATTKLRKVLEPGKGQANLLVTEDDYKHYLLKGQSFLWVDVDAAFALLKEVERMGRTSPDALPLLEEIMQYFNQGTILDGEEGLWASAKRATMERAHYRCRLWLAEAYEQQGMPGQAEMVISALIEEDPTDEDALHRLMGLLHRQGMTQQALRLYEQTCETLSKEGMEPTEATRTLIARLRQETRSYSIAGRQDVPLVVETSHTPLLPLVSSSIPREIYILEKQDMQRASRRHVLQQILGIVSLAQLPIFSFNNQKTQNDSIEEYLSSCEENILACWRLMKGNEIAVVPSVLCTWLPSLEPLAEQSTPYQKQSASLAAQGYIIASLVRVLHRDYEGAEWCGRQALEYSEIAQDNNLKVAALKHLATRYNDAGYHLKTLHTYQQALLFIEQISPLLQSRIYLGLALSYAHCQKKQEALRYWALAQESFPEYPERDPSFVYADCGKSSLNHYGGLMYLKFGKSKKAWEVFQEVVQLQQQTIIPERTVIEIVNCKAEAALAHKDLDHACVHLQEGVQGAIRLKSEMRFHDSVRLYQRAQAIWPHESSLRGLEELFH